jgi:hypothetical protein
MGVEPATGDFSKYYMYYEILKRKVMLEFPATSHSGRARELLSITEYQSVSCCVTCATKKLCGETENIRIPTYA